MKRPIGIDLFAGAGGMSLGFEQAGFEIAAAVEIDPIHAATHKFNFPKTTIIAQSVRELTGASVREAAGIGSQKIDVVFGGAPCQGFSLIGARALDDPRNALVRDFVRLTRELDADYFVFENVKGITVGKHVAFLHELVAMFESNGYAVRLPWQVLNAANFKVPQSRERFILMGSKHGRRLPSYPTPTSRPAGKPVDGSGLRAGPSCADALGDLPDAEKFKTLLTGDSVKTTFGEPSSYARALRGLSNDADGYGYRREWDPLLLTSSARTDHTPISRRRFAATKGGEVEPISRFFKLPAKGVSNTLRAGTDSARGAFTSPRPIHYKYARCVTVREMARLHGFPDWFRFHTTKWHGARQIGNAVPPPLARAIAEKIVEAIGCKLRRPTKSLALGDPALLSMDMSQASAHFGVAPPIAKRDKKGRPKRRQWDEQTVGLAAD